MESIRRVFDLYLRKYLPPKQLTINGIEIYGGTIIDRSLQNMDGYEQELLAELRTALTPDDRVCIIGGGLGITTVVASRNADQVITYEAGRVNARNIQRTIDYHNIDNVKLVPKPVGNPVSIWGREPASQQAISPESLPECDVLELDCEGSEIEVLETMTIRPRTIVVESHGIYDSPSNEVAKYLTSLGYEICSTVTEVAEHDIVIMRANKSDMTDG